MALAISPQVPSHPHPLRATLSLCVSLEGCRHARSPYTLYICDVSYREGWVCLATDGAHTSPASTPVPSSDGLGKRIPRSGKHPFPMICSHPSLQDTHRVYTCRILPEGDVCAMGNARGSLRGAQIFLIRAAGGRARGGPPQVTGEVAGQGTQTIGLGREGGWGGGGGGAIADLAARVCLTPGMDLAGWLASQPK